VASLLVSPSWGVTVTGVLSNFAQVPLNDLYTQADFITLHMPLLEQTRNMINKTSLNKCKTGVRIINCARGGIVNEGDLLEALNSGKVCVCARL
jgi:D-3-phosphoglycerate dehydrogenase